MPDTPSPGPLRRKLRPPPGPLEQSGMTPAKAMRRALTRALEGCAGLEATVSGFLQDRATLADILTTLEGPRLVFMTQGQSGAIGLGIWDIAAVAAVVEHLVTGRVVPGPPEDRAPTPTDAAVLTDMFDRIMQQFDDTLAVADDLPPVTGFRASSVMENARAVALALDDVAYRRYRVSVDFSGGAKTGELQLIFPWRPESGASACRQQSREWALRWEQAVKASRARIEAVLFRLPMPLEKAMQLQVGDIVVLPRKALDNVSLEGPDRKAVAVGRLGQSHGMRAVRLHGNAAASPSPADLPQGALQTATSADIAGSLLPDQPGKSETPPALPVEGAGQDGADAPASSDPAIVGG